MAAHKKELPYGEITDMGLKFTLPNGHVIIFTSKEYEERQSDRRLEIKTYIPKYYTKYGE